MKSMQPFTLAVGAAVMAAGLLAATGAGAVMSGGDGPGPDPSMSASNQALFAEGADAISAGNYAAALAPLGELQTADPRNADVLNMLGYATRQLGQYQESLEYYRQALSIDPEHLGANEYLGELYLALGNLAAAQERLAVLDEVCLLGCDEYDALAAAIDAFMVAE